MTEIVAAEPEVLVPLDKRKAESLDKRIRRMADTLTANWEIITKLVGEAKAGRIHEALGFPSWTAYLADALGGKLVVEGAARRELVQYMVGEGMSVRAIATVTGVSKSTVDRDIQVSHCGTPEAVVEELVASWSAATAQECTDAVAARAAAPAEPAPVTGLDGKQYPKPKPKPRRRTPLPDALAAAVLDLARVTKRINAITADDRVSSNRGPLKRYRWDIVLGCLALREAVENIDGDEPSIKVKDAFALLCDENSMRREP